MAYRNEMTVDERIVHHSIESWYAAEAADRLHEAAEKIRALPPMPDVGELTVRGSVELIGLIVQAFDKEAKLMYAGIDLLAGYTAWHALRAKGVTA